MYSMQYKIFIGALQGLVIFFYIYGIAVWIPKIPGGFLPQAIIGILAGVCTTLFIFYNFKVQNSKTKSNESPEQD